MLNAVKKLSKKDSARPEESLEGKKLPKFKVSATGLGTVKSEDLSGSNWIIYFYPKDDTPGCTTEGEEFSAACKKFQKYKTKILGVSPDSVKSHEKFKNKFNFSFELLSDEDKKLCEAFKVWKEKSLYGRKYMGVERSTFLVNAEGKIVKEWRKVKVKGHVEDVLEAVKNL